jgi:hypothetical protein
VARSGLLLACVVAVAEEEVGVLDIGVERVGVRLDHVVVVGRVRGLPFAEIGLAEALFVGARVLHARGGSLGGMCRNIRTLHNFDPPATHEEIHASALQYVRKISGMNKPSRANEEAFERAVADVTAISTRLLGELTTAAPPKDREVEAAKARARAAERYAA